MTFPKDSNFTSVSIERFTGGSINETTGNWNDSETDIVAEADIDIQPKTGSETNSFRGLTYNKTLTGFLCIDDINYNNGFTKIMRGDIVDQKYKIKDIKDWLTHYELQLEQLK